MFRSALVTTQLACLLVLRATRRIDRLAAVHWRHSFLHTVPEGWANLVLARGGGLFA